LATDPEPSPDPEPNLEAEEQRLRADAAMAELGEHRARADHVGAQRDHLAIALRDVIDAHYHWREAGEGKTGPEADFAAQRFIDARTFAHAALAAVPALTVSAVGTINSRLVQASVNAFAHATKHQHEGVEPIDHFVQNLMEQLAALVAAPAAPG
jgi:hypothetical protein